MSVESLEFWKNLFEIAGVVLLLLTFFAGAGVVFFSRKLNAVQAKQLREFDKDLTDNKGKVAGLEQAAADAGAEMARQQTRAATGNVACWSCNNVWPIGESVG